MKARNNPPSGLRLGPETGPSLMAGPEQGASAPRRSLLRRRARPRQAHV